VKILHLSTFDVTGGAARSAYRIHSGLRRLGYDSQMFVARRQSHDQAVTVLVRPKDRLSRLEIKLRRHSIKRQLGRYLVKDSDLYEIFTHDRSKYASDVVSQLPDCDVINLHWIADFVDYPTFFAATTNKPMVWTLHDMNPFTGGCHYDNNCGKWKERCGACPQLVSCEDGDLSREIWERKKEIFKNIDKDRLQIVTPSSWMAAEVKRSPILGKFPVTTIPYGLDLDCFAPRDSQFARNVLGVFREANAVLCLADSLTKTRKGFGLLSDALLALKDVPNLFVISVGSGRFSFEANIPHLSLDFVENERFLSLIYSAADVFVVPSRQDNLPNTGLESLACGTPVVGFDVGGIPELIRPGITGILVPRGDTNKLCSAIKCLFENRSRRMEMAANCRRIAVEEYSLEVCARRYVELYTQIAQ
jgi:glycosyltransferase involved in cell wall biosynthesis